uniref:Uncharacterized protein n=1 Tax=Sphaerodactylus townsendi TaxID=933632 RepID=A0ACB8EF75_9SAUR
MQGIYQEGIYQDSYGSWAASQSASGKEKRRGGGSQMERANPRVIPTPKDDWKDFMKSFVLRQQATLDLLASQQQKQNENSWQRKPFPKYEPGLEVTDFLHLFESACKTYKVPTTEYLTALWSQVSGVLAKLLCQFTKDGGTSYTQFKDIALKRFGKSGHELYLQFRKAYPKREESMMSYVARCKQLVSDWFHCEGVTTVQEAIDTVVKEQFLQRLAKGVPEMTAVKMGSIHDSHRASESRWEGSHSPGIETLGRENEKCSCQPLIYSFKALMTAMR